jgi:hypothetical protein
MPDFAAASSGARTPARAHWGGLRQRARGLHRALRPVPPSSVLGLSFHAFRRRWSATLCWIFFSKSHNDEPRSSRAYLESLSWANSSAPRGGDSLSRGDGCLLRGGFVKEPVGSTEHYARYLPALFESTWAHHYLHSDGRLVLDILLEKSQ